MQTIIITYFLINVRFGSLLGPRGLLLKYMWGENSDRENPVNYLPAFRTRLLGACLAPAGDIDILKVYYNNLKNVLVTPTKLVLVVRYFSYLFLL